MLGSRACQSAAAHPPPPQTVLGIILGGGAGSRLYPLTKKRAKPAVPLGANYRLIDIPVSNCINSGVNKIYCLTQFNSASLNRHLSAAYVRRRQSPPSWPCLVWCGKNVRPWCGGMPQRRIFELLCLPAPSLPSRCQNSNVGGYNSRGFVEVLAASQTTTTKEWFQVRSGHGACPAARVVKWSNAAVGCRS